MNLATKNSQEVLLLNNETLQTSSVLQPVWRTNFAFECCGLRIGIRLNQEFPKSDLSLLLPPYSKEIQKGQTDYQFSLAVNNVESVLWVNENEKMRFPGNNWILDALRAELKSCVSQNSPERVFIHAGVVAWQNNLILIPGAGFAGKTTLTAELVKAGAIYYSDDMAIVDTNGLVYPYPKPLSMRQRKSTDGAQTDYDVAHFKGVQAVAPLPASLVVITEYQRGGHWQPRILTAGQGVLEILKYTTNSLKQPRLAVQVLQKIAVQAKIIKSKRGEAHKIARAILLDC